MLKIWGEKRFQKNDVEKKRSQKNDVKKNGFGKTMLEKRFWKNGFGIWRETILEKQ